MGGGKIIEVAYSGGKDSDVILQLTKEAGIPYRAIYKNTTIDQPGTLQHVKQMGVDIITPEKNFGELIAKKGQPNRFKRFCCKYFKEYKVLDKAVIGVRREESAKRASRYKEPTQCRVYKKGEKAEQIFPILDWTSQDIIDFADDRKLKFAPLYYDDEGKFHVERRLGCMCCPLASKKHRIEEFRKHNGMIKLYLRNIQKYMDSHPDSKMTRENGDCYGSFARDLFYTKKGAWKATNSGLFKHDFKRELEQFFETDLTI